MMTPLDFGTSSATDARPRKRISYVRWMISILIMIPVVFVWALFLKGALLNFELISGSMEPTLEVGDRVLVKTGELPEYLHGLVVCLRAPDDPHELLAKRVIGQEGDTVQIRGGEVYLNGSKRPVGGPPYVGEADRSWEVGPGEVFVLGDNRNNSNDSKDWGPIPREDLVGLVWLRYLPFSKFGRIE